MAARPRAEGSSERRALRLVPGLAGASKFDRLIHERMRLAIVSALSANDTITFNELKEMLDVTDGNLSVHARKLEEAGYVKVSKSFRGRVPHTDFRLTARGWRAFDKYVAHMEALIRATRAG